MTTSSYIASLVGGLVHGYLALPLSFAFVTALTEGIALRWSYHNLPIARVVARGCGVVGILFLHGAFIGAMYAQLDEDLRSVGRLWGPAFLGGLLLFLIVPIAERRLRKIDK